MIYKSKPLSPKLFPVLAWLAGLFFKSRCKKLNIDPIDLKPGHSYILMCNHFSFWDGFWAFYICNKVFMDKGMKKLYIMSLKKQMDKNKWLRHIGSFSIDPGKRSINETFDYAAEILSEPGNLLLFYPQGKLESMYTRYIKFDEGLYEIVPRIKGDCQLIWSSTTLEFFESVRPTLSSQMLDCGTNHDFNFDALKKMVNEFHVKALTRDMRYTEEPITYKF